MLVTNVLVLDHLLDMVLVVDNFLAEAFLQPRPVIPPVRDQTVQLIEMRTSRRCHWVEQERLIVNRTRGIVQKIIMNTGFDEDSEFIRGGKGWGIRGDSCLMLRPSGTPAGSRHLQLRRDHGPRRHGVLIVAWLGVVPGMKVQQKIAMEGEEF